MALTNSPAILAPLAPPKGADIEAMKAWASGISSFLETLALSLEETSDAAITDASQLADGTITTAKIAANAITSDVAASASNSAFGSTETQLHSITLAVSTGKAQIFASALFTTTAQNDQTITYRIRKGSITGTVLRTATIPLFVGGQASHRISALDASPAASQVYVASAQATAGSAVLANDSELLATGFNK